MRIAVITGGATAERAVAFAGAAQIVEALRGRGHTVRVVDTVTGLLSPTNEQRLLTTAVGREPPAVAELDGRERAMLSNGLAGLKEVTGADVLFLCLHAGRGEGGILQGVLGDVPLPVGEIIPKHELFDYECKYTPGMSEEIFPAKLDTTLARQLQELALTAHRALKLGGYSRVDFRLSPEGDIFCLEANTLPGMTRTSLLPQAARAAGIEFPELCERICRLAGNSGSARGG